MLGVAGLMEPSGREIASLSADDMIKTFQQKHRYVPERAHHLACAVAISFNCKTFPGVGCGKLNIFKGEVLG